MGMLDGHPDLRDFQHPILLAVQRDEICFGEQVGVPTVYEERGKEWKAWVGARYVVEGILRVILEVVVGVKKEEEVGEEIGVGRELKGMVEEVGKEEKRKEGADEDEDEHRAKRRKVEGMD